MRRKILTGACLLLSLLATGMEASVKIGTTISGTYADATGNPAQSHLIYAATSGRWWLFTLASTSDSSGNPGTHVIKTFVSSSSDLTTATWSAGTDSPNLDSETGAPNAIFEFGRALAVAYIPGTGTDTDIAMVSASMYATTLTQDSINGTIRATLSGSTITWGPRWGVKLVPAFNVADTNQHVAPGNALKIGTDGYLHEASMTIRSELDAAVWVSVDVANTDTWTTGGRGTGNIHASTTTDGMSTQVGLQLNQSFMNNNAAGFDNNVVATIPNGTSVTTTIANSAAVNGVDLFWSNFSNFTRTNITIDNTMTHESAAYGFAQLASGAMLVAYCDGVQVPHDCSDWRYSKGANAHSAGVWNNTVTGDGNVFGTNSTQKDNDYVIVQSDTTHVYAIRRTAATTLEARVYSTGGNSWSALGNQPPTMTGKTIKAGGGVFAVSDGTDVWVFVIDSTDNAIKYTKLSVGAGTWGAWTTLTSVGSTAAWLSGYQKTGNSMAGVVWTEQNGSNFDTWSAALSFAAAGGTPTRSLLGVGKNAAPPE